MRARSKFELLTLNFCKSNIPSYSMKRTDVNDAE